MKHARKLDGLVDVVDIVGTGNDGVYTVNISTGSYLPQHVVEKLQRYTHENLLKHRYMKSVVFLYTL